MPFPYSGGGMENPEMIYLCPSVVLAGKVAERLYAHELLHSWFGNYITCKNWTHLWINEGFTVLGERFLLEKLNNYEYYQTIAAICLYEYEYEIAEFNSEKDYELTKLVPYVNRRSPNLILNTIPYEKGFTFLKKLELLIGHNDLYAFFRKYLQARAYTSVATEDFQGDFIDFVKSNFKNSSEILSKIDWEQELRGIGMSIPKPNYDNKLIYDAKQLANEYIKLNGERPWDYEKYLNFGVNQQVIFIIELLYNMTKINVKILDRIDLDYKISQNENNPEILFFWLQLNIKFRLDTVKTAIEKLVIFGRNRYLFPIYKEIAKINKNYGRELLEKHINCYNKAIIQAIKEILK